MDVRWILATWVSASGCLATNFDVDGGAGQNTPDSGAIVGVGPYCEVARVFAPRCGSCHGPGGTAPDLSFEGAKSSLVGVQSRAHAGATFIVAHDPAQSLLYRKMEGTMRAGEGGVMPPQGALGAAELAIVSTWINAGASFECDLSTLDGGLPDGGGRVHPEGFASPTAHGPELELGAQDCRSCHGADLRGASGPSCDSCHMVGWRTNCTFCHGGTADQTGAPPRDLGGALPLSFRPHPQHVASSGLHGAFDCTECHRKPTDVLSAEHVFDSTPGRAEVIFSGGLSSAARYDGAGTCSALYCHGNGRTSNGSYRQSDPAPTCESCHPTRGLGGRHGDHLGREVGATCYDCHADTIGPTGAIASPGRHVNGAPEVHFAAAGMTFAAGGCSGMCHGQDHLEGW